MATTKNKSAGAPAGADTTATTGAATGTLAQTDTGVNDGNQAPATNNTQHAGPDGGAADAVLPTGGEGLDATGAADTGATASNAGTLAAAGAASSLTPVGGDDVQAPAKGDAGSAAPSAFALPTLSEVLDSLRELPPDELAAARAHLRIMNRALSALDRETHPDQDVGEFSFANALADSPPIGKARAVVLFSAGAVRQPIGDLVEGTEAQINSLAQSGDVDRHPDAVAAAVARGAYVHTLGT